MAVAAHEVDDRQSFYLTLLSSDVLVGAHAVAARTSAGQRGDLVVAIYNVQMRPTPSELSPAKAWWASSSGRDAADKQGV